MIGDPKTLVTVDINVINRCFTAIEEVPSKKASDKKKASAPGPTPKAEGAASNQFSTCVWCCHL